MKKKSRIILTAAAVLLVGPVLLTAQQTDKGKFVKRDNPFYDQVKKELAEYYEKKESEKERTYFKMDLEGREFPTNMKKYETFWHNPVEPQARTSTCWSFATTSYLESDIYRLHGLKIKLSQMFVVYHEYLEKAAGFVASRGESYFPAGSEANAVTKIIKKYGIVPYEHYSGKKDGIPFHDHSRLHRELADFLEGVKKTGAWNREAVLDTVKAIMNHYLGKPPAVFVWEGRRYNPKSFTERYLQLNPDDYVDILSYLQQPFYEKVEYEVPDNWWHDKSYHNVPLEVFMDTLKSVVQKGYSVAIGGDVSEPGYNAMKEVAVIPTFDIPREYIDDHARQFRFSNRTTTDDHGIHIVGYGVFDGDWWFVIKDSGSGARNGENVGYRFIREDYVKLKFMDFMVHRSAVEGLLEKFN